MFSMFVIRLRNIFKYRRLLWDMAVAQLKAKYTESFLGLFWAFINPILTVSAIYFVFIIVLRSGIKNYPLFVLSGMLPWSFFSASLNDATVSITSQRGILRQFQFPIEIIPLSSAIASFLNYLIGFTVIYTFLVLFNNRLFILLPFLVTLIILNLIFVLGLSLIFSITNVFIRDLEHVLGFLMMFWFWITPIFYSADAIPSRFLWVYKLNPISVFVLAYREIILYVNIPPVGIFFEICFWSFLSLGLGLFLFKHFGDFIFKKV